MIRVIELFAGVGGFRLGLELASDDFKTVFANQWEPNKKKQWAYENYCSHWENHNCICEDITKIDKTKLPKFDLLVGGNPCVEWSVATLTKNAKGLEGSKGGLWYQIYEILKLNQPKYFLLENVDRQLKSPSKCKGRDFATMLYLYNELGYEVEWRVINSAKYGNPQRRKRVYVFGCKKNPLIFSKAFPIESTYYKTFELPKTIEGLSKFSADFKQHGFMKQGLCKVANILEREEKLITLADIKMSVNKDSVFYLTDKQIEKFKYFKGSKRLPRVTKDGHQWIYSEGAMAFPDELSKPSRTMLTSEGSVNRCSHVIDDNGLRFLTPIECERLNGFPDGWTDTMPNRMRYFTMGNALVVPLITRIGKEILKLEDNE